MPALGADMDSGTLIAWLVAPGDHVRRGDIVAEVDTDKSVIEVETFTTGTVEEFLVLEGQRVPVGTPLAIIREDDAAAQGPEPAAPEAAAPGPAPSEAAPSKAATPEEAPSGTTAPPPARRPVSPRARRRAAALGVDLAAVVGTGPDGAVTTDDVEAYAARAAGPVPRAEPVPPREPAVAPLSGADRRAALRQAVGASMAKSKREIPHYYVTTDIEVGALVAWLEAHNASAPITERVLPAALLLKAVALALRETPDLNGTWAEGAFHPGDGIHVGVAIAMKGGGLVAPAIHAADTLTVGDLMAALRDLVSRARTGGLRAVEMAEPTITVTNLGDQGVDTVLPVIYPPQVAMVGFGRIRERPWAIDGLLGARPVLTATLAADHRASDGHRGAVFLTALDRLLHTPEEL